MDDDELADLRRAPARMAFPTLAEGFGLPILEAMAEGLPVMASDLPVLREVGGDAALWFDPLDLDSIADALRTVATRPEVLPGMAAAGLEQARLFCWERVAEETLAVFRTALAPPLTGRLSVRGCGPQGPYGRPLAPPQRGREQASPRAAGTSSASGPCGPRGSSRAPPSARRAAA